MAKSRSIGAIYAELSLRDGKFKKDVKSAGATLKQFTAQTAKYASVGLGAGLSAAGLAAVDSMTEAINKGGELQDMMTRTGAAGKGLVVMEQAFNNAGIAGDKVPDVLNRMQKALTGVNKEGEPTNQVFDQIGVSIEALKRMDPVDAFKATAEAIAQIQDPAQRTAAAMGIFGKSGGELLAIMSDTSAFSQAEKQAGSLGTVLAANAARFDELGDKAGALKVKYLEFGTGLAEGVIPQLERVVDLSGDFDAYHAGKGIGDAAVKLGGMLEKVQEFYGMTAMGKLTNWWAESNFGGGPDVKEAKRMAEEWRKIDDMNGKSAGDMVNPGAARLDQVAGENAYAAALDKTTDATLRAIDAFSNLIEQRDSSRFNTFPLNEQLKQLQQQEKDIREGFNFAIQKNFPNASPEVIGNEIKKYAKGDSGTADLENVNRLFSVMNRIEEVKGRLLEGMDRSFAAPALAEPAKPIAYARPDVNDYQKRGLFLGGNVGGSPKVENLIEESNRLLKEISRKTSDHLTF